MHAVQALTLLIIRVNDLEREVAFYRDGLGMEVTRHVEGRVAQFALPQGGALELTPGGEVVPPVQDRREVQTLPIFRVADVHAVVDRAVRHGARVVNAPFEYNGQWLAYLADPEGHVFGVVAAQSA
ncbi:MAG: VOC family protein [Chloroflexota bacterium]|nr:VOC family protein [Dehalococcoidia bacterium]MDW8253289.1 VOC family protein [Chloroflexota bacterium]